MKKCLILTVLLAVVPALGFSQEDNSEADNAEADIPQSDISWAVRNVATWIEAVNGIREGGNGQKHTITVTGTVSVPAAPSNESTFGTVTGVTVTIEGSGTLSPSANGSLLLIGTGQTVVAKDVVLRGRDGNNASVVGILSGGLFRMEGKASVTGNKRTGVGGGVVVNRQGTFVMQDSTSVSGNTASYNGGGVYVDERGTFTMQDGAQVSGNTSSNSGGVYNEGTFTMQGNAQVTGNTSKPSGGSGGGGGGVYNTRTFTMKDNTSVSDNTASAYSYGIGSGGVYNGVYVSATFTMQDNASVSGNKINGNGGGVYNSTTFTMQGNAQVSDNTASVAGGGVHNKGTFTMQGNASVSGNTAASNRGGGVYVDGGTFTMKDSASASDNTSRWGGGVFVDNNATFTMQDSTAVSGNTADHGGGVYVESNGTFAKTGGTIYGDDAEQNLKNTAISGMGYAVYEAKNKGWRNATAGPRMNPSSYGFWLNEEAAATGFPPGFIGVWSRYTFNNTLTFTSTTVKSSSRDVTWKFINSSGDTYTLEANTAAKTKLTLAIKYIEVRYGPDYLEISGDSGNGENNWNGDWYE
jgi:predicted outer membrane repeat protein